MSTDTNEIHPLTKSITVESKQQQSKEQEIALARYGALVGLWSHHNAASLQWPPVIISAALIVVSLVVHVSGITHTNSWGVDPEIVVGAGIPLLLTGLGMITMLYIMGRSRKTSKGLEEVLVSIEEGFEVKKNIRNLNHPPGLSGLTVIRSYMALFLALPITLVGFLLTLGLLLGGIIGGILILVLLIVEFWQERLGITNPVEAEITNSQRADALSLDEKVTMTKRPADS